MKNPQFQEDKSTIDWDDVVFKVDLLKSQENVDIERYNRTVRYEWLACDDFESLAEVQETATQWLGAYNNEGPHIG